MNTQKILLLIALATTSTLSCSSEPHQSKPLATIQQELNNYFSTLHIPAVKTEDELIDYLNKTVNEDLLSSNKFPCLNGVLAAETEMNLRHPGLSRGIRNAIDTIGHEFSEKKLVEIFPETINGSAIIAHFEQ